MEILQPIVLLVDMIRGPIGKCVTHHKNLDEIMNILRRRLQELNGRKEDVYERLSAELLPEKKPKKEVELWLEIAERINKETQTIERDVGRSKYLSRACLRKPVFKMIREVEEHHRKGSFPDSLVVDAPPSYGEILPSASVVGETTAKKKMEEIWACLTNDDVRKVGVYGMGGSGKTTIMRHIHNQLVEKENIFDSIIWVTVSKALNLVRLQNDIALKLGIDLSKYEYEAARADILFAKLRETKKWVLILDDMWEAFRLEDVGIPEPTVSNGCRLVLTTRSRDVCRVMGCKDIKMELLTREEAWHLFLNKAGNDILLDPNLEPVAKQVADECACLPLAVVTIAGSMKGVTDTYEWKNALEELKESTKGLNEMGKVLERLKFSYIHLKDEKLQQCLLYCALYPEDFRIERKELIEYLIAEGIVEGMKTMQATFNKGHAMLNMIENASLLESYVDLDGTKFVKMHDLIRDLAIQITTTTPQFLVEAGVRLTEIPDKEKWKEDLDKVSLMNNYISEIPYGHSPRCQKLSTLLLRRNTALSCIAGTFFANMLWLRVLDISYTNIEDLPNSFSDLENLTALFLTHCDRLRYVPSLAKFRALSMLDLSYSGIKEIPEGMENLVNLIYLNLSVTGLDMMPTGVLTKLFHLQHLHLWGGLEDFKVKQEEIAPLRKLESFAGKLHERHGFLIYVRSLHVRGLENYFLWVEGDNFYAYHGQGSYFGKEVRSKKCKLIRCSIVGRGGEESLVLPNDVEFLDINSCHDFRSLSDFLVSSSSIYYTPLPKFKSPPVLQPPCLFSCLKKFSINCCPELKNLFTHGMGIPMPYLEEAYVYDCQQLEEIKAAEDENQVGKAEESSSNSNHSIINDSVMIFNLPKLKALSLSKLPELKSICKEAVVSNSIQYLTISSCPKLKRIPLFLPLRNGQLSAPPYLKEIYMDNRAQWQSLEWEQPGAKNVLEPFCIFLNSK